jgi:hypothetical protein
MFWIKYVVAYFREGRSILVEGLWKKTQFNENSSLKEIGCGLWSGFIWLRIWSSGEFI